MFVQEFKKEDLILFPVSLHSYGRSNRDSEQRSGVDLYSH